MKTTIAAKFAVFMTAVAFSLAGCGGGVGCMDPTAANYNPSATSQSGITCTYSKKG